MNTNICAIFCAAWMWQQETLKINLQQQQVAPGRPLSCDPAPLWRSGAIKADKQRKQLRNNNRTKIGEVKNEIAKFSKRQKSKLETILKAALPQNANRMRGVLWG